VTDRIDAIDDELERYARAVRELRALAVEARARLERADAVVTEAQTFIRDRRRRAARAAAKHT
jgi:hypothetical protein